VVRERVGVYWVRRAVPRLDLVGEALGVGGCKDADLGRVAKRVWQVVHEGSYGLSDADGSEDAGAEQGLATKFIVENILGSRDVGVHP
jgi:hypothetical protein